MQSQKRLTDQQQSKNQTMSLRTQRPDGVDADTVNDAGVFFKKSNELATATTMYLVMRTYRQTNVINPIFRYFSDNVIRKSEFLDNQTKATQVSQYELVLQRIETGRCRINDIACISPDLRFYKRQENCDTC